MPRSRTILLREITAFCNLNRQLRVLNSDDRPIEIQSRDRHGKDDDKSKPHPVYVSGGTQPDRPVVTSKDADTKNKDHKAFIVAFMICLGTWIMVNIGASKRQGKSRDEAIAALKIMMQELLDEMGRLRRTVEESGSADRV